MQGGVIATGKETDPVYAAAWEVIMPTGAFLRCDRGEALYVTNLPAKANDWTQAKSELEKRDFICRVRGEIMYLTPGDDLILRLGAWMEGIVSPGELTRLFMKRRGMPLSDPERVAVIEGLKRLRLPVGGDYEKRVRQAAAEAMRLGAGGALWAAGLLNDLIKAKGE